jgi:hypothetical protein
VLALPRSGRGGGGSRRGTRNVDSREEGGTTTIDSRADTVPAPRGELQGGRPWPVGCELHPPQPCDRRRHFSPSNHHCHPARLLPPRPSLGSPPRPVPLSPAASVGAGGTAPNEGARCLDTSGSVTAATELVDAATGTEDRDRYARSLLLHHPLAPLPPSGRASSSLIRGRRGSRSPVRGVTTRPGKYRTIA